VLSDRFIRNAKPGKYADEEGLYLKVYSTGKRSFIVRTRTDGKDKITTIGTYPQMGLAVARETLHRMKGVGYDIPTSTFNAFEIYYEKYLVNEYKRPEITLRYFMNDVLPEVGKQPLHQLTRAMLTNMLQKIVDRGSPVHANRVLSSTKKFLEYCEQHGWISDNPLERVKRKVIGGKETARTRTLSFDELADFFDLLYGENNMSPGTRWTLYFILLTGTRASEALHCLSHRTLEIPPEVGKTRAHRIPSTPYTRAALKLAPSELPRDHRVLSHALRRLQQTYTPHDLRRTFASRLADIGVMPHVIEKLLNHKMEGVMAVYNRAEYWPERVAAQKMWGLRLSAIRRKKHPGDNSTGCNPERTLTTAL